MVGALLAALLAAEPAFERAMSREEMQKAMHADVDGERWSALPFIATGAVGVGGGLALLASDSRIGQTAAWPLLVVGILEVGVGAFFGLRAGPHQRKLDALLAENPAEFSRVETRRATGIRDRNQPILLAAEAAIIAGGLAASGAGLVRKDDVMIGVGLGLVIQGLALFLIDWDVYERAKTYAAALERFIP